MGISHLSNVWSPSEDAELRSVWPQRVTLKSVASRFPGRSFEAIRSRGIYLGLGKRPRNVLFGVSYRADQIVELIRDHGPMDSCRLQQLTGLNYDSLKSGLFVAHRDKRIFIEDYAKAPGGRHQRRIWAIGPGHDACRNVARQPGEVKREWKTRKGVRIRLEPVKGAGAIAWMSVMVCEGAAAGSSR